MSLINTMLRDLENRRASELGRRDWQREIRALPPARPSLRPLLPRLYLGLAILLAPALFWLWTVTRSPAVMVEMLPPPVPLQELPSGEAPRSIAASGKNSPTAVRSGKTEAKGEARSETRLPAQGLAPAASLPPADKAVPGLSEKPVSTSSVVSEDNESRPLSKAERRRQQAEAKAEARAARERAKADGGETITKTVHASSARERAEAEYRRGQALAGNGNAGEAMLAWYGALAQDPAYIPARQSLVRALIEERRSAEAAALLSEGLDVQPAQIAWAMTLARLQVERQDIAGAAKVMARAQPYAGSSADFAGFQGHLAHRLGQPAQAVERYQAALAIAPGEGRWWFGLAQAKDAEGKTGEAQDAYRRAQACGNLPPSLLSLVEQKLR